VRTVFIRALENDDKAAAMNAAIHDSDVAHGKVRFELDPATFEAVPRSPFAYWVSDRVRRLFSECQPFEGDGRIARGGMKTQADERFLRATWECLPRARMSGTWVPLCKGGVFSPIYSDIHLLGEWGENGRGPRAAYEVRAAGESWGGFGRNEALYFRPGLTWSRRSQLGFSLRVMPAGCIFNDSGPAAFCAGDNSADLLAMAAVANSTPFAYLMAMLMAFGAFQVGVLQRTPIPNLTPGDVVALARMALHAWSLKRSVDTRTETSHAFVLPVVLQVKGQSLADQGQAYRRILDEIKAELATIQSEIDERCFTLYRIDDEDRRAITEGFEPSASGSVVSEEEVEEDTEDEGVAETESSAETPALAAELVSWAVGVAFGRFDVRLATGDRPLPSEPEPFDPLPICAPGMLTGDDGLPLALPPAGYPLPFPDDGILVDDPGHPRDLTAGVRAVFEVVFGSRADSVWQEVAALLDPRDHDLRRWLASGFFEHHLRRHSRSRRKGPILWQFGIPSGRYSIWCYAHRMTRDSLLAIQNDIVGPKLSTEERRLSSLVAQAGQAPSARERADIATQQAFIDELRTLLDEVRRVAPLWNPDLDDGIVLVMAPLWRLVPTQKAWQRELRTKWNELVSGKYDWAHLAMHLWPERVVPKCASDRSLAIAHGLEDVFWAEASHGKWAARKKPTQPTAELVTERTSAAVKAALTGLVDSPSPINSGKRSKNSRQSL